MQSGRRARPQQRHAGYDAAPHDATVRLAPVGRRLAGSPHLTPRELAQGWNIPVGNLAVEPFPDAPVTLPESLNAFSRLPAEPTLGRIDLHCHSTYSPERLFGVRFAPLLDPVALYRLAKQRGMTFVTITDHDTIDGCLHLLNTLGPLDDFIIGQEISAVFPDDGMCVHVNVYDINEAQHREIQRLRTNIFDLVPYLRSIGKLHQLNHFTWNERHRPFSPRRIEQLAGLFEVFEAINGTRTYRHNSLAWQVLDGLGKSLTAGSDSHTDRVGTTYTLAAARSKQDLLTHLAEGRTALAGAFGSTAGTLRDTRVLIRANLWRMRRAAQTVAGRAATWAFEAGLRALYRPLALSYYAKEEQRMRQFNDACQVVLATRRTVGESQRYVPQSPAQASQASVSSASVSSTSVSSTSVAAVSVNGARPADMGDPLALRRLDLAVGNATITTAAAPTATASIATAGTVSATLARPHPSDDSDSSDPDGLWMAAPTVAGERLS